MNPKLTNTILRFIGAGIALSVIMDVVPELINSTKAPVETTPVTYTLDLSVLDK